MDNHKVSVRQTKKYGRAVYADQKIRKGEIIAVYDGPTYDDDFDGWTKDLLYHTIQIGPGKWRDSLGLARLINHSCEPNCGIRGLNKVVAMRAIEPGEEITWDYEMAEKSWWFRMKCKCGKPACRKVIGDYARMPRSVRKKYAGYISEWLVPKKKKAAAAPRAR